MAILRSITRETTFNYAKAPPRSRAVRILSDALRSLAGHSCDALSVRQRRRNNNSLRQLEGDNIGRDCIVCTVQSSPSHHGEPPFAIGASYVVRPAFRRTEQDSTSSLSARDAGHSLCGRQQMYAIPTPSRRPQRLAYHRSAARPCRRRIDSSRK